MSADITISMIAAVAANNVIGRDGDIPWYIPSDFAHFKRTTMGKPLIMGRKQFESVGKPLPGRVNIVVSRQPGYQPDGVVVINDFVAAIDHAKTIAKADGVDEIMIIGGGEIYRLGMGLADRLYISHVDLSPDGTILFPTINSTTWEAAEQVNVEPSERDGATYSVTIYQRRSNTH